MKPKAALVKDQFVEGDHTWSPGDENKRGRLSLAAKEHLSSLVSKGWDIEGFSASKSSTGETIVSKVKADPSTVSEIPDPTRDEDSLTAWAGTKQVGMRTVCNNCRRSLTYCLCPSPKVWLDHNAEAVVTFRERR